MNILRCVLIFLLLLALFLGSVACQKKEVPKQQNVKLATTISIPQSTSHVQPKSTNHAHEEFYLVPYLKDDGAPVACMSDFWPEVMGDECMNNPGVPFKAELPLTLTIWSGGTVIWRVLANGPKAEYFEARVPQETVSNLLAGLNLKEFMTPENFRYSDQAVDRFCPASVIMVSKGFSLFPIGSNGAS